MKTLKFVMVCLLMVFITNVSCGTPKNDNQKTAELLQHVSPQAAMTAEVNIPTPESSPTDQLETVKKGEKLFKEKNCAVCHQLDTKLVGPALKDVSKAYAGKKEKLNSFLKGNSASIIDPAQHAIMEPQIAITKAMSDADRMAIVEYLLSISH